MTMVDPGRWNDGIGPHLGDGPITGEELQIVPTSRKSISTAKGCFGGSQEAPAAWRSLLCKLDHELEQRACTRYLSLSPAFDITIVDSFPTTASPSASTCPLITHLGGSSEPPQRLSQNGINPSIPISTWFGLQLVAGSLTRIQA
jgi:hypothetical protein